MSEEKKKEQRKKRRRLSEEEKEKLRRRPLLLKAIQFKRMTDVAILVSLLLVVAGAFLPLINVESRGRRLKVSGLQVVLGHETESGKLHGLLADGTVYARVVRDRLTGELNLARGQRGMIDVYDKLSWPAYAFVGVYPLAALLVLLYLLDLVVPLGRPLPVVSSLFGVLTLAYVLLMVMFGGPFNAFRGSGLLVLLLGTFVLAFASLLRLPNSARKRRRMLRAAKKGEPLDPFFAPAEKKEEAPPVEAEPQGPAEKKEEPEGEKEEAEEKKEAAPEEEAQPAETGEPSEESADSGAEAADAPEPEGGEAPSEESEPEKSSEDDSG